MEEEKKNVPTADLKGLAEGILCSRSETLLLLLNLPLEGTSTQLFLINAGLSPFASLILARSPPPTEHLTAETGVPSLPTFPLTKGDDIATC